MIIDWGSTYILLQREPLKQKLDPIPDKDLPEQKKADMQVLYAYVLIRKKYDNTTWIA